MNNGLAPLRALENGNNRINDALDAAVVALDDYNCGNDSFFFYRAFHARDYGSTSTVEVVVDVHKHFHHHLYLRWRTGSEHVVSVCYDMKTARLEVKIGDDPSTFFYDDIRDWASRWDVDLQVVERAKLKALLYRAWENLAIIID